MRARGVVTSGCKHRQDGGYRGRPDYFTTGSLSSFAYVKESVRAIEAIFIETNC